MHHQPPTMVRALPTSVKMGNEVKSKLYFNGFYTAAAAICHTMITIIIFILGYSNNHVVQGQGSYSVTVVICGFGALETCVFAYAAVYSVFAQSTKIELPSWNWLNSSFISSVASCAFLVFFLWPALVVFIIHEQGQSFFSLLNSIQEKRPQLFSVIQFHIVSAIIMLMVDLILIGSSTFKLVVLQAPRRADDEDDLSRDLSPGKVKRQHINRLSVQQGVDDKNDAAVVKQDVVNEAELAQPLSSIDYIVFGLGLVSNILYFANLVRVCSTTVSSGTVAPCILFGILLCIWIAGILYFKFVQRLKELTEDWLVNFRSFSAFHFAVTFCFFYISLCILLLDQIYDKTFFQSLASMSHGRGVVCWILLVCFPITILVYSIIVFNYSRIMWQLDEIASLRLLERTRSDRVTNKRRN